MEVVPAGNRYTLRRYLERGSKELKTRPFRRGHWLAGGCVSEAGFASVT